GGRALPDPGDDETGLALEEPVGADTSGCPSLGWVVSERGDLDAATGGGDHQRLTMLGVIGANRAEERHAGPGGEADPGHPTALETLRPDQPRSEPQQRGIRADEGESLGTIGEPRRADDLVALAQTDHLELVRADRPFRRADLDDTVAGTQGKARRPGALFAERREPDNPLPWP